MIQTQKLNSEIEKQRKTKFGIEFTPDNEENLHLKSCQIVWILFQCPLLSGWLISHYFLNCTIKASKKAKAGTFFSAVKKVINLDATLPRYALKRSQDETKKTFKGDLKSNLIILESKENFECLELI
jgi:hypothetical protein